LEVLFFRDRKHDYIPSSADGYKGGRQLLGIAVVFGGIIVGVWPILRNINFSPPDNVTEQADKWYWLIAFSLSTTFNALQQVYQDVAFHDKDADVSEISCLAWYNLYSILMYLITIPMEQVPILNGTLNGTSLEAAFQNQEGAFRCFFGHPFDADVADNNCQSGATMWPLLFCVGYVGMFGISAFLINKYGALFSNLLMANIQLASTGVFMIAAIVTPAHVVPFNVFPIVGCVVILIGIAIKGEPAKKDSPKADINGSTLKSNWYYNK